MTCSARTITVIALTLVLSGGYFAAHTSVDLPDHESYEVIYSNNASNFMETRTELVFVALVQACQAYGLTYDQFRTAVLVLSLAMLLSALALVRGTITHSTCSARRNVNLLDAAIISFATYGFALEFLEIRIRSGIAISAALLSFAFYLRSRWRSRYLLPAGIFAVVALGLHGWTAAMLVYLLYSPVLAGALCEHLSRKVPRKICMALALVLSAGIFAFLIQYTADRAEGLRGEHLLSELNPARYFFIGLAPLIFAAAVARLYLRGYTQQGTADSRLAIALARFHFISFANTVGFAGAVTLFYLFGALRGSGEALVRLHGAFVPVLLVGLPLNATKLSHMSRFVVVGNALFFLNALYAW